MEYKRVDRIMKQVERHYQGEFSINGDWQYSQRLLKRYREESQKKFNGQNGFFGTNRMFCTEGCAREGELFAIPSDQVVYGPYFAFAQGTYYACFDLSGDLSACSVEVSSQKCGVLASGEVGNIEQDGRIMLPFTLPEDVDDLELKVINQGQGLVYFKSVLVTDTLEIRVEKESEKTEIDQETVVAATIPEMMFSKDFGEVAGLIEEAVSLQNVVTKTTREANRAAECALPEQGRFRKVKRLIRKVINCYVHFQLEFNHKVTGGIWTVVQELQLIIEIVKQQFLAIGNLERQIAALREEVVGQKNQLNAQNAIYLQQKAELDAQRAKFGEQKAEFDAQKILFDKQKAIFDEQKAMFELREASYAADLSHYRQETQKLNERVENADRHTSDVLANLETICQKSEEEISKQVEEIARKNEDILCQMRLRFEQLEQMIEHAKNETDQKPVCDDNARTEIGHLWSKIREVDQEFRSVWQSNRDVNANLNSIWHTYNTFRQEVFYEMDHRSRLAGNTQTAQGSKQEVRTVIHSTAKEKIAQSGGKIRLNLGSGALEVDGYLSVDARQLPGVDVVAEVSSLPYEAGSVDEIFSAHLIEHFTAMVMEKELLPYWHSLLKDGGVFRVVFPDLEAMIEAYKQGEMKFENLAKIIMGGQDYQLDYHYAVYSPELVVEMLKNTGFKNIEIVARGRENGGCRETEIVAMK